MKRTIIIASDDPRVVNKMYEISPKSKIQSYMPASDKPIVIFDQHLGKNQDGFPIVNQWKKGYKISIDGNFYSIEKIDDLLAYTDW